MVSDQANAMNIYICRSDNLAWTDCFYDNTHYSDEGETERYA